MKLEDLLGVFREAREAGGARGHDLKQTGRNLQCGDEVTLYVRLDGGRIADISYEASGCAVSTTFTYVLSKKLKGKGVDEILDMGMEEYLELVGLGEVSPGRMKCALIPLVTLKRALRRAK